MHRDCFFRLLGLICFLLLAICTGRPARAGEAAPADDGTAVTGNVVARIYFRDRVTLARLAAQYDVFEAVNHAAGYCTALLRPAEYAALAADFRVEIEDQLTAAANRPLAALPDQSGGIPGYPCYRTVEEMEATLAQLAAAHPDLARRVDIGDSWDRITAGDPAGYDLYALVLTNRAIGGPKPRFFVMAGLHARELAPAELAARFAEHLVAQYGHDADVTWLLDYFEVHIVPQANPDGRKWAEQGYWWRKNTDSDDGCTAFPYYGTDLNRNSGFQWYAGYASADPCSELYRGPAPATEPEVQAIESYVRSLFPDQRGPGIADPAPAEATGLFITLHAYGDLVLYPWFWSYGAAPNQPALQTLGRKLGYFNGYWVEQAAEMYPASGTTDDWAYGELGVAAYTFEVGSEFFEACSVFENRIWPDNLSALLYAFKSARRPYRTPAGPDIRALSVNPARIAAGTSVTLTAIADDSRLWGGGSEPIRPIAAARLSVDAPSWTQSAGTATQPLAPADGAFDSPIEALAAMLDTRGLPAGRHTIFVEAEDTAGNWGPPTAIFLEITATITPTVSPTPTPSATPTATLTPSVTPDATATASPTKAGTPSATPAFTPTPTTTPTASVTPTATPSPAPSAIATASPSPTQSPIPNTPTATAAACRELAINGGMELATGWSFPATASQASYTTAVVRSGSRAVRFGVAPVNGPTTWRTNGGAEDAAARKRAVVRRRSSVGVLGAWSWADAPPERNLLGQIAPAGASYSSGYQTIALPAAAQTASLAFWYRPGTQATGGDFQRALLLDADSYAYIATAMSVLENAATWQERRYDLSAYRGQSLVIYWEVYNDDISAGPQTWMYLDDVSVQACAAVTPTATTTASASPSPTGTPTATSTSTPSPTVPFTATPTETPTATPTSTPSPTDTPTWTPTPTVTPTDTPSPALTLTETPTATPPTTPAPTDPPTATPTSTPSPSVTPTETPTATLTVTPTPSPTSRPPRFRVFLPLLRRSLSQ